MAEGFDYDLVIIGAGVGGHGAALHAIACGLKTAIVEAADMGGTCVNRGCIPSKALLAASGRVRELQAKSHLKALGIDVGTVTFDLGAIADHAAGIVGKQRSALTDSLKRLGIDIETRVGIRAKQVTPGSPVIIELSDGEVLEVDACLVATGRIPNTKDLGLESVGIAVDRRGFIEVDDRMATGAAHLWAIGDATGKMMLAHTAAAQGVVAVENICGRFATVDYQSIPAAAFTHPEIGFVGMTEPQAQAKADAEGFTIGTVRTYFKGNAKAIAEVETDGLAKIIYREDTGELLGVHIIGLHASDLIHEASAAIAKRVGVRELAHNVHAHPTLSEILDEAYKRAAKI